MDDAQCARCSALYVHVQELNAYITDLYQHISELKTQYDARSDSHLVRELTALNQQRESTIDALQRQIHNLHVHNAQLQSEVIHLRAQQPLQSGGFRFQSVQSPPRLAPSTVSDAPLSTSMLQGASVQHGLMLAAAGSFSPSMGIASQTVPVLSGTQRAAIAGNFHRALTAAASTSASAAYQQTSGGNQNREALASSMARSTGAADSSAQPVHARRRALHEKEGQSGAAPSHTVLYPGRPGGRGPVPAAALPQVPQQQTKPDQFKPAAPQVATGPPAPSIMSSHSRPAPAAGSGPGAAVSVVSAAAHRASDTGASPVQQRPAAQTASVAAAAPRLDWQTLSAALPPTTAESMNRDLHFLQRVQSVLADTSARSSLAGKPITSHAPMLAQPSAGLGSTMAGGFTVEPRGVLSYQTTTLPPVPVPVATPALKLRPLQSSTTGAGTLSGSQAHGAVAPASAVAASSQGTTASSAQGAAAMPTEPSEREGLGLGGGLGRLNAQIASLRSTIQALQAS